MFYLSTCSLLSTYGVPVDVPDICHCLSSTCLCFGSMPQYLIRLSVCLCIFILYHIWSVYLCICNMTQLEFTFLPVVHIHTVLFPCLWTVCLYTCAYAPKLNLPFYLYLQVCIKNRLLFVFSKNKIIGSPVHVCKSV
jgi:hypothetical protein